MSSLKKKKQDILWSKKWRNLIQQKAIKEEMNKQLKASLEKQKQEEEEKECTFKPQTLWNQSFKKTISFVDEFFVKLKPYIEQQQAYLNQLKELEYDDQMFSQKIKEELRVMLSKAVDKEIMETIIEGYKGVRTRGINKVKREKLDILSKMIKLEREYSCFMARENVDKKDLEECGFDCDLAAKLRNDILKDSLCPNSLRDFAKIRQEINQVLEEELKLRESESATPGGNKYDNKSDDTCDDKKDSYDVTYYNTHDDNYLYEKNNQGYDINKINNYLYNNSHTYMTKENVIKQNKEISRNQHISKDSQINSMGEYLISNTNKGNETLNETINKDNKKEKIIKENNNNNNNISNNNNKKNNLEHDHNKNKHYKKNSNMINIQNNYNNVKENNNILNTNNNIKYNKEENKNGEFTNLYNIVKKEFEISDNYNEEKCIQNNHNKNIYLNNNYMKILKNEEANKYISSLKKDVNSLNVIILNNNKHSNEKNRKNISSIQNGNVNENVNENVNGNVNGNINRNVNRNVNGNINGNINGNVNGNINGNVNPNMENYGYEKTKNYNKKHAYNIINEKNNLNNSGNSEQKIIYTKNKNMIKNSKYDNITERMIDKDGDVYMLYGKLNNENPDNGIIYSEVKLGNKNTRYVDKNIYNVKNGDKFYDIYRRNNDNDSSKNNNNNNNNRNENEKIYHYNNKIYNISDDHVIYDNKQFYYTKDNLNYTNKKTPLINSQNNIVNVHNLGKDYNDNKKDYVNKPLLNKIFEKFYIH
ncbi:hypothetical protein CYL21_3307 [Plasmodium falciparum NF54]|uniref:Uncharacterized protein n=3 Tax=Plasmodium falciparum TaxID=5833 RepID=C0H4E0_PLAF7|nr:conserved protein, unknown function [Plasmodium falciparum 3D7]KAF4328550.1 hypothetical protein CYL21_3307 [Plasmodium falciparum NF54]PKC45756.1 hypothetical protein CK202_3432 [Plasmodium falciparum NF54]CAX63962.1 conserved protein, unknown function [Plasmodium falciparum 3D7]|eukprot:XP_002808691.1 conserved Plasmodium protein, unknown function [Plasmodium falciparum 3D7]